MPSNYDTSTILPDRAISCNPNFVNIFFQKASEIYIGIS